jgi:hypothetical protein
MFITCIAEDDRFSVLKKLQPVVNHIPYGKLSITFTKLLSLGQNELLVFDHKNDITKEVAALSDNEFGSLIIAPIFDNDGTITGCLGFEYAEEKFGGMDQALQVGLMKEFRSIIPGRLGIYLEDLEQKKKRACKIDGCPNWGILRVLVFSYNSVNPSDTPIVCKIFSMVKLIPVDISVTTNPLSMYCFISSIPILILSPICVPDLSLIFTL